ncbi:phage major capsid protein [Sinorhizobium meliloti]|nr:phage major capsid protein [Sinorhizobium meliloti]MDW9847245.1 phage major capsid protein [Sinorhizobium meliloti]MDX0147570.1 phage major capsid protein [Sinorhizobium meliloti]MDX0150073.1 phage major capsid protein [Sinorhizobium meliloti]MDX0169252.1 phage major capsid protein [Sinorhizobium meliloti]
MKHHLLSSVAAASLIGSLPLETRNEPDDPLASATAAVEELRTGFEGFRTRAEQQLGGIADITARLEDLETRMNRPGGSGGGGGDDVTLEHRAFSNFLRLGDNRMDAEEVRALVVGDDTKGGYLAPQEFVAEVVKGLVEISPVRQAARVGSTSAGGVILPKRTGRPTAHWVGEDEERQETGSTYGQLEIPVHEAACYVDVSLRLLEDSAINVDAEVASDLVEEFGRIEGPAFINGDGVKKPEGFMRAAGIQEFKNGHAANIQPDALIKIMYSLPAAYRNSGSWMMNGTTLGIVRTLKDGQGNYLWQPSYQAGQPSTLLGRPVIDAVDMPNIAADAFPIAFGDFSRAYRIYDRVQLSILRDPYTQASKGLVRFHARRRVGGGTVLGEALRKLKMAA